MPARSRLLLIGAGHAHLEVLRRLILEKPADFDATVVSPVPYHFYSAMTPGYLAGQYTLHDISLEVAGLARQAGAACVIGRAVRLDPPARTVALEDGRVLGYDIVSLNIGSLPVGADLPPPATPSASSRSTKPPGCASGCPRSRRASGRGRCASW